MASTRLHLDHVSSKLVSGDSSANELHQDHRYAKHDDHEPLNTLLSSTFREHLTKEFKEKYNKFQRVPFIHDGEFKLAETIAIFRYLCREYPVKDNWYPKESKQRAKIDEYLEWQHLNLRGNCTLYFRTKWLLPLATGKQPDPKQLEILKANMVDALDKFQEYFISDGPYINSQEISFADILAACEIVQPRIAGYEPTENRPLLKAWLDRVQNDCNPFYDEAHAVTYMMLEKSKQGVKAKI